MIQSPQVVITGEKNRHHEDHKLWKANLLELNVLQSMEKKLDQLTRHVRRYVGQNNLQNMSKSTSILFVSQVVNSLV